jgi:hypothetical protein
MEIKLSSMTQIALLAEGNVLQRFPNYGVPEDIFDGGRKKYIDTYEIRSINRKYDMFELVMTGASVSLFSSAGDVGRIFIKSYDLVNEGIWWQNNNAI